VPKLRETSPDRIVTTVILGALCDLTPKNVLGPQRQPRDEGKDGDPAAF
jgi:hypothetical protein